MPHATRFAFIDLLRVVAAQVIVLHHLAFYGPLSDHAYSIAAGPIDWLFLYGRFAVQIFFVTGGYCLAGSLARRAPSRPRSWLGLIVERYFRIGLPYLAALALALVANEIARLWMDHPSISPRPTPGQLLAHVFLLHNVLGYDSLTAGIWYVAIDLQLVALVSVVNAIACRIWRERGQVFARWTLLALGLASAFVWNRSAHLDHYGIYFLASYMLGMAAAWTKDGRMPRSLFWAYLLAVAVSLHLDYRMRLALAGATAIVLMLAQGQVWLAKIASARFLQRFGLITYSLFLVHFPICLVVNAWWSSHMPQKPWLAIVGMLVAWILSVVGAFVFYHHVERRLARLRLPGTSRKPKLASGGSVVSPMVDGDSSSAVAVVRRIG
jgi:peptidoglycan/LPS O-acetylase OafA/YrhL